MDRFTAACAAFFEDRTPENYWEIQNAAAVYTKSCGWNGRDRAKRELGSAMMRVYRGA